MRNPYYTDKPDWDAFGAMLLVAACHTYDEPVPPTVEKDWNLGSILWSPALHQMRSRCGPCSGDHLVAPAGSPSYSRLPCPPTIRL